MRIVLKTDEEREPVPAAFICACCYEVAHSRLGACKRERKRRNRNNVLRAYFAHSLPFIKGEPHSDVFFVREVAHEEGTA